MAVTMNNVFWDIAVCGSCKNDISEEHIASIIRVTRIGELGTTLAVTNISHHCRVRSVHCDPEDGGSKLF
jgi:hypothetical protein